MEPQHYKYINITRGIAILLVICVHTSQHVLGFDGLLKKITSYGQMGVQMFFIASALTLCLSWKAREGSNNYLSFLIRRFFRIAPMYFVGILFYFFMSHIDVLYLSGKFAINFNYNMKSVVSNILLMHGLVKGENNNVVPGGWSIGAEFAFYIIFPVLAAMFFKGRKMSVLLVTLILSLSWVTYNVIFVRAYTLNSFEYYSPLSQLVVFASGIILYNIIDKKSFANKTMLVLTASIPLILSYYLFITSRSGFVIWINLFVVSLSFCSIILILKHSSINLNMLNNIGIVSFSMYINHFVIVWFVLPYITSRTSIYINGNVNFLVMLILTLIASYFMARWTYKNIECRFINLGKILINKMAASS